MKKKIAAGFLCTMMLSGTALANPFDDVPKDHWAYDAVRQLADDGIIDGCGDNLFHGDRPMMRYEMAALVGRAISREKLGPPADQDAIWKLSGEFSDELTALGVRVQTVEQETSGVRNLKISHWFQTENTYGDTTAAGKDKAHEYELEYRLTAEKQISPKLSATMQIETQTYWDQDHWRAERQDDGVYTRLAFLKYHPDERTELSGGKNAYWLAGGFLGDDFVSGVNLSHRFGRDVSVQLLYGYYNGSQRAKTDFHSNIFYGGINGKLGKADLGAHYLTGSKGLADPGQEARIWAVTGGMDIGRSGVNLSAAYGENSAEDKDNKFAKIQLYKKIGTVDTFAQYWNQQKRINLPMENGNHLTWWGDEYNTDGHDGYRLILGQPVSPNCYAEAWYGIYNNKTTDETGRKYGWALTFSY